MAGAKLFVDKKLAQGNIVVFSKSYSPECKLIQKILSEYNLKNLLYVDIESRQDCTQLENYLQILCQTDARSVRTSITLTISFLGFYSPIWRSKGKHVDQCVIYKMCIM